MENLDSNNQIIAANNTSEKKSYISTIILLFLVVIFSISLTYAIINNHYEKSKNDMQSQINNLQKQLDSANTPASPSPITSPSTSSTPTPTISPTISPTATIDPFAGWKSYTNTAWKFGFKYSSDYSITKDSLPKEKTIQTGTKEPLELTKTSDINQVKITIYVNPGGWGYEGFNKVISESVISIQNKEVRVSYLEDPESSNHSRRIGTSHTASNGIAYNISMTHINDINLLEEFEKFVSTFTFSD